MLQYTRFPYTAVQYAGHTQPPWKLDPRPSALRDPPSTRTYLAPYALPHTVLAMGVSQTLSGIYIQHDIQL